MCTLALRCGCLGVGSMSTIVSAEGDARMPEKGWKRAKTRENETRECINQFSRVVSYTPSSAHVPNSPALPTDLHIPAPTRGMLFDFAHSPPATLLVVLSWGGRLSITATSAQASRNAPLELPPRR